MGKLKAIDFFCGAGGMTNGFSKAGIDVIAGLDFDKDCQMTYEYNNQNSKFILADIKNLSFEEFEKQTRITKNDENMIFIGCSPCQYWSKIKTDKRKSEESKNLLKDFQKFVEYYKPGYIVIENVPGIYMQKNESPLVKFLKFLDENKYTYKDSYGIINASHFGVPQTRKRFLLMASRVTNKLKLPEKNFEIPCVKDFIHPVLGFPRLVAGDKDENGNIHTVAGLSAINMKRLELTKPDGGSRISYVNDKTLAIPSQYKRLNSFSDSYGRMSWSKPAPTITTKFFSISNGRFAHPDQNRAISLREGATLQTFDLSYNFFGNSISGIAKQIGNAVPPILAKHIANVINNCNS